MVFNVLSLGICAQNITFVYVAHDETVPTDRLVNELEDTFNSSDEDNQSIMYLAFGDNSKVIMSSESTKEDVDDFFNEFYNYDFHSVSPKYDLHRFIEIVGDQDLLGKSYDTTTFLYYLSKSFFRSGYFEEVVAKGIFCLELDALEHGRARVIIKTPEEDGKADSTMFPDSKGLLSGITIRYMTY